MAGWLRNWFENLTQARIFHPSWIPTGVLVSALLAGIVWGAAALRAHVEIEDLPLADPRVPAGHDASQGGGAPTAITPPVAPRESRQKTIQVRFLPPGPASRWERIPAATTPAPARRVATLRRRT